MNIRNVNKDIFSRMQFERDYLERIDKAADELNDLGMNMSLDPKQQADFDDAIRTIESIRDDQHSFTKAIEKKVLKQNFDKQNGRNYSDRDPIIKYK